MMGRHGLGGAYGHIKAFEFSLIPTSKESAFLRLVGPTCLVYAGENTDMYLVPIARSILYLRESLKLHVLYSTGIKYLRMAVIGLIFIDACKMEVLECRTLTT